MNTNLNIFEYEGNQITFNLGNGDVMVNLTEVAKAFPSKNLSKIVNSLEIKEYVQELSAITNVIASDLLIVENGNGSWAHQRVALRVAQKLSTRFAIWVDERIEYLLKHGSVGIQQPQSEDETILIAMQTLAKRVESQKVQLQLAENTIKQQAPKVEYHDRVLQGDGLIATNVIAKELGMSAVALNKKLHEKGIIYKCNGTWVLYAKYENKGYTDTKTTPYIDTLGRDCTSIHTYWTERGRQFIHEALKMEVVA